MVLCLFLQSCKGGDRHRHKNEDVEADENNITIIGNPDANETPQDNANSDFDNILIPTLTETIPGQLLKRDVYLTSYNHDTKCPNWVAWVLTRESAQGNVEKKIWFDDDGRAIGIKEFSANMVKGTYIYDAEAEKPCPGFADWDEMPAGMSHGHMCPAADCQTSPAAINQSFLLTNMCVQAQRLNTGSWNRLEMKCRNLAIKYGKIYIVTGPIFNNGKVTSTMGKNKVAIPDAFFKVLLCLEGEPKAIGFIYPNNNDKQNMQDAVRTVNQIEEITSIDFFPQLLTSKKS